MNTDIGHRRHFILISTLGVNYGDMGPQLQYSHVNSTLGIAGLSYSHFRLQVWDRKGRDSGGRSRRKLFSLGVIGDREIGAVGVFRSPYNLPQACGALFIYISSFSAWLPLISDDEHQQGILWLFASLL